MALLTLPKPAPLAAVSAYRTRLNKAFTIQIERSLSIKAWLSSSDLLAELAFVGSHVAEQIEHLHGLLPWRNYGKRMVNRARIRLTTKDFGEH
jgi:hypothetical protein